MADSLDTDVNSWLKQGGSAPVSTAPPPSDDATAKDVDTWLKAVPPSAKPKPKPFVEPKLSSDLFPSDTTEAFVRGGATMTPGGDSFMGMDPLQLKEAMQNPAFVKKYQAELIRQGLLKARNPNAYAAGVGAGFALPGVIAGGGGEIEAPLAARVGARAVEGAGYMAGYGENPLEGTHATPGQVGAGAVLGGALTVGGEALSPLIKSARAWLKGKGPEVKMPKGGSDDGGGGGGGGGDETDEINGTDVGTPTGEADELKQFVVNQQGAKPGDTVTMPAETKPTEPESAPVRAPTGTNEPRSTIPMFQQKPLEGGGETSVPGTHATHVVALPSQDNQTPVTVTPSRPVSAAEANGRPISEAPIVSIEGGAEPDAAVAMAKTHGIDMRPGPEPNTFLVIAPSKDIRTKLAAFQQQFEKDYPGKTMDWNADIVEELDKNKRKRRSTDVEAKQEPEVDDKGNPLPPVKNVRAVKAIDRKINSKTDHMEAAIAKLGGLNSKEAEDHGIDPADIRARYGHRILRVFTKNGRSFDAMAEALSQHGYPVVDENGNYTANDLLDSLDRSLRGTHQYSSHGADIRAEEASAQREDDLRAQEADHPPQGDEFGTGQDLAPDEYPPGLTPSEQTAADLMAEAKLVNPDKADAIIEQWGKGALNDNQVIIAFQDAINETKRSAQAQPTDFSLRQEEAPQVVQGASGQGHNATPAQPDLLGNQNPTAQALHDRQLVQDRARNTGQASVETGNPDDMFSQARRNRDIEDLQQALRGTNATHTPITLTSEGHLPPGWQWNSVRFGTEDIRFPVRDEYARPSQEILDKIGHRQFVAEQAGRRGPLPHDLMTELRRHGEAGEYPWWSRDMKQNVAYALGSYLKHKDIRQIAYARVENTAGADAILANPEAHALTFNWKDDYMPDKTVVKCGI